MDSREWQDIAELLETALGLEGERRNAFCAEIGDENLRRELKSLLAVEEAADDFLKNSAIAVSPELFDGETLLQH